MGSQDLFVEADAAVMQSPAYGAGAGNHLPIGSWSGVRYRSLVRFPILTGGWGIATKVTKATLYTFISDFQHVGPRNSQIYCRRVNSPWTKGAGSQSCESGFSAGNTTQWADTSAISATDQVQFSSGTTANATKTLDVTAIVEYYRANAMSKITFIFDQVSASDYSELWADEYPGYATHLVVEYESQSPPTAPTQNLPAAGAVSITQTPTFTWTHNDPQSDPQASAQVRVWDAAGTTQVGTTQTVSGATASLVWPTALTRGTSYQWDVATADAANGYGPFSAKRAFSIKALPVVTIDATRRMVFQGGAPRLQVNWSVTGGTQASYRVQSSAGYDSGTISGTATSLVLATQAVVDNTAQTITVTVTTTDPLTGVASRAFTPRYGLTVQRRDLTAAPTAWGTPSIVSTVPSGATLQIEYGSSATATAAPSPNVWYSSLSAVPKARYVFYRAWLIPSATTSPTLDKITIPSSVTAGVQAVDKWSTTKDGVGLAGGYAIDPSEFVYGSRSMTCVVAGAGPYICYSYKMSLKAGRTYILTGLMKSQGNSGALFRLQDTSNATLVNDQGQIISSSGLTADAEWFTPDRRDVVRYATPLYRAVSDMDVWIVLRAGGTAGAQCWWDAIKLEESTVATPWSPGAVGAVIIDAGGVQVDASEGGVFRLLGTAGGVRDVVQVGANGLDFGGAGDTNLYSATANILATDDEFRAGGDIHAGKPTTAGQSGIQLKIAGGIEVVANAGTPYVDFKTDATVDYHARIILASSLLQVQGLPLTVTNSPPIIRLYTANATWTKPAASTGFTHVVVEVVGGGGGGGGAALTAAGQAACGGCGGGGGYSRKVIFAAALGATEAVTSPAGAAGGTAGANNGATGGTNSFGAHAQATGGVGGTGGTAAVNVATAGGGGGVGSLGTFNMTGGFGANGGGQGGFPAQNGLSGASVFGGATRQPINLTGTQPGANGSNYGAGGSGGSNGASQAAVAGGTGNSGVVIVTEYYSP